MSEKVYALLLRLYPSRFRKEYEGEALQLVRDRLRHETGLIRRVLLWVDLAVDMFSGLPHAYRNSYSMTNAPALSPDSGGKPSFGLLEKTPLGPESIAFGSALALIAVLGFGFLMNHPVFVRTPSNGSRSSIEAVMQQLNRPSAPDLRAKGNPRQSGPAPTAATKTQIPSAAATGPTDPDLSQRDQLAQDKTDRVAPLTAGTSRQFFVLSQSASRPARAILTAVRPSESSTATVLGARSEAPKSISAGAAQIANPNLKTAGAAAHNPVRLEQPRSEDASKAMAHLFQTHDIVLFGEVHGSKQEYAWLCQLVNSPEFDDRVDDIVVEFGNSLYQDTVDRYVAGEDVPFEQVQNAWRNMIASVGPVSPVYGSLYQAVREANLKRRGKHQIRLVMGSPPGDWDKIKSSADLAPYEAEREQWYVQQARSQVLAKHHRALLIMGAGHFLRGEAQVLHDELLMQNHRDVPPVDISQFSPGYIEQELLAAGANPYVVVFGTNAIDNRGDVDKRFASWPAPVLVPLFNNWVGALPAQPVISGGHAAATPLTLADEADALLYVAPCNKLSFVNASSAEIHDTAYEKEVARRDEIIVGHPVDVQTGEVSQCARQPLSH
jgi:hypothetical protein